MQIDDRYTPPYGHVGLDPPTCAILVAVDVETGRTKLWKTIEVPDPAGVRLGTIRMTRDARSYAYGYTRGIGELYLVEGLK